MADYNKSLYGNRGFAAHVRRPPCCGCDDRHEACHGSCERYAKWKAENDKYRETHLKGKQDAASVTAFELRKKRKRAY